MEELYISHAKLREFRGQALYMVPSMFLEELPHDGVEVLDLCHHSGGPPAAAQWRSGGGPAAAAGWAANGLMNQKPDARGFAVGVLVQHDEYGVGKITDISGFGATRQMRVMFPKSGERTFRVAQANLKVIG